jgi:hypothetical protein
LRRTRNSARNSADFSRCLGRANLSAEETARAAGVTEEMVVRAEAEEALPADLSDAIETLIGHIN